MVAVCGGLTSFHKETSKHMGPRKHKYIKSEMLIYKLERLFISCLIFIKHVSTSDILTFFSQMIKDRICLDIQPLDKASELTYRLNFSIVSAGLKENIFQALWGRVLSQPHIDRFLSQKAPGFTNPVF